MTFFQYWKLAFFKALSIWWDFVWDNYGWAATLSIVALVLSAIAKRNRENLSESFRQWRSAPMGKTQDWIWGGVGVLALIGASFLVCLLLVAPWHIDSEKTKALGKATKAADAASQPQIKASIEYYGVGWTEQKEPLVLLVVRVVNIGTPSIADLWRLSLNIDGKTLRTVPTAITGPVTCRMPDGGVIVYPPEDALYQKSVNAPIGKGGVITGFLTYVVPDLTDEQMSALKGSEFSLTFIDVENKQLFAANKAFKSKRPFSIEIFPGTNPAVVSPPKPK